MHPARLFPSPLPRLALLVTLVLLAVPRPGMASPVTSSILSNSEGEFTGDFYAQGQHLVVTGQGLTLNPQSSEG